MGTTICETLVDTVPPCKGNQFLVVENKVTLRDAQWTASEKGGKRRALAHAKYWVLTVPETQVHFSLSQVLVLQIAFNSMRCIRYCSYNLPIALV